MPILVLEAELVDEPAELIFLKFSCPILYFSGVQQIFSLAACSITYSWLGIKALAAS